MQKSHFIALFSVLQSTYPTQDQLADCFDQMVKDSQQFNEIYDRAIFIFLRMARTQFFYDVNKRMGRFMMNGLLLDAGFPVINVPVARQLEFNTLMLDFYTSDDQAKMNAFLKNILASANS